jgi:hypothetical protein
MHSAAAPRASAFVQAALAVAFTAEMNHRQSFGLERQHLEEAGPLSQDVQSGGKALRIYNPYKRYGGV